MVEKISSENLENVIFLEFFFFCENYGQFLDKFWNFRIFGNFFFAEKNYLSFRVNTSISDEISFVRSILI